MPIGRLFVSVGEIQDGRFAEWFAEQLESYGQLRIFREAAWDTNAADSSKIAGDREDIRQIHLQRVSGFFAYLERGGWGGGGYDGVDFFESLDEVVADQRAHFLSAKV